MTTDKAAPAAAQPDHFDDAGKKVAQDDARDALERLLVTHDHLTRALRIPAVPWPDPHAHGHEAAARAIHSSFCAVRFAVMDAIGSLTAARAALAAMSGKEQGK